VSLGMPGKVVFLIFGQPLFGLLEKGNFVRTLTKWQSDRIKEGTSSLTRLGSALHQSVHGRRRNEHGR
jgi:hypothetical protein